MLVVGHAASPLRKSYPGKACVNAWFRTTARHLGTRAPRVHVPVSNKRFGSRGKRKRTKAELLLTDFSRSHYSAFD
jgi:hypothetical protein